MWKTIQIVGTAILAGLAVIMQIKPDDAKSNLSAWLSLVIDNVPSSFISPTADKWAVAILALAAFLLWSGPWLYKRLKKSRQDAQVVIRKPSQTQEIEKVSPVHADKYPDIRVADSEAVLDLFMGAERAKLIALLEAGSIKSWARSMVKGQTPPGVETDALALAPDVWSKHRLEHTPKGGEGTIAQTFLKNDRGYSIYYDVWLNSTQIAEAFPLKKRITIKEFIEIAGKSGWNLDSTEILDLERGVRQAALDGDLLLFGRPNTQRLDFLNVHQPLEPIPKDHWKDYQPELLDAMNASDNIKARTWSSHLGHGGDYKSFVDLHINTNTAMPWLKGNGLEYKGWNEAREQERNKSR